MIRIEYPSYHFRTKEENGKALIFDELRKLWLRLTPEEWVRQNFVRYLVEVKKYPAALIAQEKEMQMGELKKRFDILVYNRRHEPWLMVECKSTEVQLDGRVLEQVLRYNIAIPVQYLVITNGSFSVGFEKTGRSLNLLDTLPDFADE